MKVLVTGVAGFIGSRLAEALLAHGHEVSGIDNLSTGRIGNVPEGVDFRVGDVREPITGKYDLVYHAAASYKNRNDWENDASTNVLGTINAVRAAQRNDAKLVYFQTALCYGPHPVSPIKPDAELAPVGSYPVSKTAGECYIRDSGVEYVSLRLANVYGPRNLSGPIPTFFMRLTQGLSCVVMDARRDFVYVDDLVWLAVNAGKQGRGVYHVSSGRDHTISELFLAVATAIGDDINAEPEYRERGADDVPTLLLDPSETEREFGWTARTSLADGVHKAVEWYRSHPVTETYTHLAMPR